MSSGTAIPSARVWVAGDELVDDPGQHLVTVRVAAVSSQPSQCEVTLVLPARSAPPQVSLGEALEVEVEGDVGPLFDGEVTGIEHRYLPDGEVELRVRGYDLLHRLRQRQTVRSHERTTVEDLAASLTEDLGLKVDGEVGGPEWPRLVQHRHSDLELLQEASERIGAYFSLHEGVLHLWSLDGIGSLDPLELELGSSLLEARIDVNGTAACTSVRALGWSTVQARVLDHEEHEARSGRDVEARAEPEAFDVDGARTLVDGPGETDEHLTALARAELDRRVHRQVVLEATAEGDSRLRPGATVSVVGTAPDTEGRYLVARTVHTVDGRGYRCELSSELPQAAPASNAASLTLGIVSDVDDPHAMGRVRATLPAYNDIETDWMGVVIPGAGAGKGMVALADVGDTVVVAFAHGDPAQGIVLGGLYGSTAPPDSGVTDGAVRRFFLGTPGGQRAVFDDVGQSVRLDCSAGSWIELAPEVVRLHAATDLVIEAPGKNVTVRAKRVDFVEAAGEGD